MEKTKALLTLNNIAKALMAAYESEDDPMSSEKQIQLQADKLFQELKTIDSNLDKGLELKFFMTLALTSAIPAFCEIVASFEKKNAAFDSTSDYSNEYKGYAIRSYFIKVRCIHLWSLIKIKTNLCLEMKQC